MVLGSQGEHAQARGYHEQALKMCQALYPPSRYKDGHPHLSNSLTNLGSVPPPHGAYPKAKGYFEQALKMRQALYPPSRYKDGHPDLAASLTNLARSLDSL